ncbi:YdeI/OmpD-associated family protein [Candidatus Woesearchaeota archaeon]|nr:YdeI/OmpD-associated family protein [Candidatus Woesearchaeota archaeon]
MPKKELATGVVHEVPADMRKALTSSSEIQDAWNDLTPLARNEWICWVTSVQKQETHKEHIDRLREDLLKGKRRPCCWMGCVHRKDKSISPSQRFILGRKTKSNN